jgi:hypothetical protein
MAYPLALFDGPVFRFVSWFWFWLMNLVNWTDIEIIPGPMGAFTNVGLISCTRVRSNGSIREQLDSLRVDTYKATTTSHSLFDTCG